MEERFKRIGYQVDDLSCNEMFTFVDTKTGVNYLYVHSCNNNTTSSPCIIPLLDKDGKPYISNEE